MKWSYDNEVKVSHMVGKTFRGVEVIDNDNILFHCDEGTYRMWHSQECCELVEIESIVGDLQDLIGTPMLGAEEVVSQETPEDLMLGEPREFDGYGSETWTFYKFKTIKGYVDIRWCGSSNGYYSESVDVDFIPKEKEMICRYV
jgi:hypothetical protein